MSVNGIEIKEGQTWETRGGGIAEVASDSKTHPLYICAVKGQKSKFDTSDSSWSVSENGRCNSMMKNPGDLIKLIGDVKRDEPMTFTPPPTVAEVDANALAAETLKSLGWVFVANAWVREKAVDDNNQPSHRSHPLYPVVTKAIEQAMFGKGERHGGNATPFLEQPWVHYGKMHGRGFLTGQASKKLEEAASKRSGEAFETEVLGAIVYAGMAVLFERGEVR